MLPQNSHQNQLFPAEPPNTSSAAIPPTAKRSVRKQSILDRLAIAGSAGLTRHELAEAIGVPLSSICGLTTPMLRAGDVCESGNTRLSPFGRPAKTVVLPQFARRAIDA